MGLLQNNPLGDTITLCCLVLVLHKQEARGNSPGSDPASVSMTTLRGPLSGSSWGFLSRVTSSLCFHKAYLVSTEYRNKVNVTNTKYQKLVLTGKGEIQHGKCYD